MNVTRWGLRVARASTLTWAAALVVAGLLGYGLLVLYSAAGVAASLLLERYWQRRR